MKTIVIRFMMVLLLCPLMAGAATPESKILADFRSFLASHWTSGLGEAMLREAKLVQDERNGYLQATDVGEGYETTYIFAYWKMDDGARVYGFSETSDGMEGSNHKTTFWRHGNNEWVRLNDVLPPLSLTDFWDGYGPRPDARYLRYVQFDFTLPRVGTKLAVRIRPVEQLGLGERSADHPEDCELLAETVYDNILAHLTSTSLELLWDGHIGNVYEGTADAE